MILSYFIDEIALRRKDVTTTLCPTLLGEKYFLYDPLNSQSSARCNVKNLETLKLSNSHFFHDLISDQILCSNDKPEYLGENEEC